MTDTRALAERLTEADMEAALRRAIEAVRPIIDREREMEAIPAEVWNFRMD